MNIFKPSPTQKVIKELDEASEKLIEHELLTNYHANIVEHLKFKVAFLNDLLKEMD